MPVSGEFLDRVADLLVASGIGTGRYSTSGVSVQVSFRRDVAPTVLLLTPTGGLTHDRDSLETQSFQAFVDSTTLSGARDTARALFDFLHETGTTEIGGHAVTWIRALAPPQAMPTGPNEKRFQFSVNFDALLAKGT